MTQTNKDMQKKQIGGRTKVYVDGIELVRLPLRSVVTITVESGTHSFRAGKSEISIPIQGGEEYFIRMSTKLGVLIVTPTEQGNYEVSGLPFVEPKDSRDSSRRP